MKLEDGIYKPYYRNVQLIPNDKVKPQIDPFFELQLQGMIRRIRSYDSGAYEDLEELRKFMYNLGKDFGKQHKKLLATIKREQVSSDDQTRFALVDGRPMGPNMRSLFALENLRKEFARGHREAAGVDPEHRMCIKVIGLDVPSRPLQNVGEVTAFEDLINSGAMKASALKDPYV